jgi:hypothetical protein
VIVSRNQSFEGIIVFWVGNLESIVLICFQYSLWKFGIDSFNLFQVLSLEIEIDSFNLFQVFSLEIWNR